MNEEYKTTITNYQEQSNYHEKVKEILWEYISKNDEEEIFKRIARIK